MKASWTTSSASPRRPHMRYASENAGPEWRSKTTSKARACPSRTSAIRSSSARSRRSARRMRGCALNTASILTRVIPARITRPGELGLRSFLEQRGHTLVVTSDKDGANSVFERELPDAEVVISQPFWPAYLTAERIAKAPELRLALTAGIGSDHVDLQAAMEHGLTVAEVTYCNSISVAEHVVMMILALVRNYLPSYKWVLDGGWNIADCVSRSYDLEGMQVGTVAAGRIGSAVLRRLQPFEVGLHYTDRHRLPAEVERELGVTFHETPESLVEVCDVVTINAPLHPETEHLFDERLIARMKRGAYLINTARGKICDRDAVARACEGGRLAGYAGDVWFPQPAPRDHPWRSMPHHGMTPHTSGTSLSAQARYAAGVRD